MNSFNGKIDEGRQDGKTCRPDYSQHSPSVSSWYKQHVVRQQWYVILLPFKNAACIHIDLGPPVCI